MGIFNAIVKDAFDFVDRNKVSVLAAVVVAAGILTSGVLLSGPKTPATQPIKPASTHAAIKHPSPTPSPTPTPAVSPQTSSPAPVVSVPRKSVVAPVASSTVVAAAPANVATAVAPPVTPPPSLSSTPTPEPDPIQAFDPRTDILQVPIGGSSATVTLFTLDGSDQYWSSGTEAFSWNDMTPPADKPLAPEWLVIEYPQTDDPYQSPSISFHVHSTVASTVGFMGQTSIAIGDWTKSAPVLLQINYQIVDAP